MKKKILLYLSNNWDKVWLNNNSVIFKPKHMVVNVDWSNLKRIKSLSLPFILVNYDNDLIVSLEASAGCIRAVPIYYCLNDKYCIVSDSTEQLIKKSGIKELDELSVAELLSFGFTTADKTLIKGIKCLQAGDNLSVNKKEAKVKSEYIYNTMKLEDKSEKELKQELKIVSEDVFNDLIYSLKGKTAVVPLSGGLDSRFIVAMLSLGGVKDVVTFSWGIPNNEDMKIGKAIADKLGYEWYPVTYTKEIWESAFDGSWFLDCLNYAHNYNSIPGVASVPFINDINNYSVNIKNNYVFIPGIGGAIAGSQLTYATSYLKSTKEVAEKLFSKYNLLNQSSYNTSIFDEMTEQLNWYSKFLKNNDPYIFEIWVWRERQAKFIANVTRFYEFFNYSWSSPLFDNRLIDFWSRVPISKKHSKILYKEFLEEYVFNKLDINFKQNKKKNMKVLIKNTADRNRFFSGLIEYLKSKGVDKHFQKYYKDPDVFGFDFALPLLAEKAQKEFNDSHNIVNNYKKRMFSDSYYRTSPYSYLSEFVLTSAIDNLNKIECEKIDFIDG